MARPREFDDIDALSAVEEQFWNAGYAATSMADLMRASGLGKGSLYAAFGDKRQLFLKVLHRYIANQHEHLRDALGRAPRAIDGLRTLFDIPLDEASDSGARRGCLLANSTCELSMSDGDVLAMAHQAYETTTELIAECVSRARDEGDLSAETDTTALARSLLTAQQGMLFMSRTGMSSTELEATARALEAQLLPNSPA